VNRNHLAYVIGCLAFLTLAAMTTGCAGREVVTVRVPSEPEIQSAQKNVAKDASELGQSASDLAKLYYQKAKAAYCKD
jgi:hypothetical protein